MRRSLLIVGLPCALAASSCGTDVAGPSSSLVACLFLEPHTLAVGEAARFDGARNQSICLEAGDDDAAFLYIPFHAAPAPAPDESRVQLSVSVVGAGVTPPSAAAVGAGAGIGSMAGPEPVRLDHDFHRRLREREIAELGPRLRPAAAGRRDVARPAIGLVRTRSAPSVGEVVEYNVAISCTREDIRQGRVAHVSDHAVVVAELEAADGLTQDDFRFFAAAFDTLVHPVALAHFGEPTDIDGNGRVIIFFTSRVNTLSPPDGSTLVGGFFWSGDLFPAQASGRLEGCAAGNQAEMFYLMVPDPQGRWGPETSVDMVRQVGVRIIGHEYQHLINAARRMYVNDAATFERTWLNEGLSHIAEELLFFRVTGLPRRSNIDVATIQGTTGAVTAFNRYVAGNFGNLAEYLARPDTASLMGPDNLTTRGATWSFLRYAVDRSGRGDAAFFHDLVNATTAGLENLDAVTGGGTLGWMRDWTVALYADDHVPGIGAEHTQPSWHKRDIYRALVQRYPLQVRPLSAGSTHTVRLQPGGAEFALFELDARGRATLHVETDGRVPGRTLRGSVVRIR